MRTLWTTLRELALAFGIEPKNVGLLRRLKLFLTTKEKYNAAHTWIIGKYVRKGSVVFDVGANNGDYVKRFIKRGALVVAFEPGPVGETLAKRYPIKFFPIALADTDGEKDFWISEDSGLSSLMSDYVDKTVMVKRVQCRRMDSLDLGHVDFIKTDVQGMDYEVLLGARETLKQFRPVVLAEYWKKREQMIQFMASLGYTHQLIYSYGEATDVLFIPVHKKNA